MNATVPSAGGSRRRDSCTTGLSKQPSTYLLTALPPARETEHKHLDHNCFLDFLGGLGVGMRSVVATQVHDRHNMREAGIFG